MLQIQVSQHKSIEIDPRPIPSAYHILGTGHSRVCATRSIPNEKNGIHIVHSNIASPSNKTRDEPPRTCIKSYKDGSTSSGFCFLNCYGEDLIVTTILHERELSNGAHIESSTTYAIYHIVSTNQSISCRCRSDLPLMPYHSMPYHTLHLHIPQKLPLPSFLPVV